MIEKLNGSEYEKLAFCFISEVIQHMAIVTMKDILELVCSLSNGAFSNNLE